MKTNKELKEIYWDFIREMRASRKLSVAPSHIRSLDVTHTRKPAQSLKIFSPNGSGKQKSKKKVRLYTDSIVTMISADGLNHTPCILFTFNPRMAPMQKSTERGNQVRNEFLNALETHGITEDRIVYT